MNKSLVSNDKVDLSSDIVDAASLSSEIECHSKCNKSKKDIIIEWAKEKAEQGEFDYDIAFNGKEFVRYRTKKMTELINDNFNRSKISTGDKLWNYFTYFYEIDLKLKTKLRLQFVLCYKHNPEKAKMIYENYLKKYKNDPRKESDGYNWVFSFSIDINDSITEKELKNRMDIIYDMMKKYEASI